MMDIRCFSFCACVSSALLLAPGSASAQVPLAQTLPVSSWQIVVNNGIPVPGDARKFNSYNQPSINVNGLVVFRGRSKGGESGEPAHGVFLRDMSLGTPITTFFDRTTPVPPPNNLSTPNGEGAVTFTEPPSFPRIDMWSNTVASRGSHQPVWEYKIGSDPISGEDITTRAGTTGIYTNPFENKLISGANNLGVVPEFDFFRVPEETVTDVKFDVFPGAPAVADNHTIVFKGNYTASDPGDPTKTVSRTGVYYRTLTNSPIGDTGLQPAGGRGRVVLIANSTTLIPGTTTPFGSTAPLSAVGYAAVFAGFDNEDAPTKGGIYLAMLNSARQPPPLTPLIQIGGAVPGEKRGVTFNKLGEGLSFDGRFVGFWGAWGSMPASKGERMFCSQKSSAQVLRSTTFFPPAVRPSIAVNITARISVTVELAEQQQDQTSGTSVAMPATVTMDTAAEAEAAPAMGAAVGTDSAL
ncbi:MAG TPA: hypothetical protein VMV57_09120 [Terracidiphilus sp.]|nr:hypothetical protein [Terracidiphilus sp.]